MTLEDKYNRYLEYYYKYFIHLGPHDSPGCNIPAEYIFLRDGNVSLTNIGDGTINIAHHLQYLYSRYLVNDNVGDEINNSLLTINRLIDAAYKYYNDKYPELNLTKYDGYFMRDDVSSSMAASYYNSDRVISSYTNSVERIDEDPTWSNVVSQDQLWNLSVPFMIFTKLLHDESINEITESLVSRLFGYVIDHNHTIYNPYLSQIVHDNNFIDFSNTLMENRRRNRSESFNPTIKVKREANNWYYSYGFRRVYDKLTNNRCNRFITVLTSLLYHPLILAADRVYFPIMNRVLGVTRKDNSYYCLATSSGSWYSPRFSNRLIVS